MGGAPVFRLVQRRRQRPVILSSLLVTPPFVFSIEIEVILFASIHMEAISALKYGSAGSAISVRILRKWIPFFRPSETWYLAVDRNGDAIQILAEKPNQNYVDAKLIPSHCYVLKAYTCTETNDYQKTLKRSVHMNIGPACSIVETDDTDVLPTFWFDFCTLQYLESTRDKNPYFPDIIGVLKKVKDCKKGDGETFIVISLIDKDNQDFDIILWKECIASVDRFDRSKLKTECNTIVAVTNVKSITFSGAFKIQSTTASYVYVNPNIPESHLLLQRLQNADDPLSILASPDIGITLEELCVRPYSDVQGKTFVCRAHIHRLSFKNAWYNVICPSCGNEIARQGVQWFCVSDGIATNAKFLYNLSAIIKSGNSSISVVLTDESVFRMVGKSCEQLVKIEGYDDRKTIPPIFEGIKYVDLNFHIKLGRRSTADRVFYVAVNIVKPIPIPDEKSISARDSDVVSVYSLEKTPPNTTDSDALTDTPTSFTHRSTAGSVESINLSSMPKTIPLLQPVSQTKRHLDFESHVDISKGSVLKRNKEDH